MQKRTMTALTGVAALATYAAIEKSVAMLVSAIAIGLIVHLFRNARMRERIIAVVVAALGGGILAEIVLTVYRHGGYAKGGAGDSAGSYLAAIQIGLVNAGVIVVVMILTAAWFRLVSRRPD